MIDWLKLTFKVTSALAFHVFLFLLVTVIWVAIDYNASFPCESHDGCINEYLIEKTQEIQGKSNVS